MLSMQESTIKSNFAYMRLLCGLLLFSIVDCCLYSCRNLKTLCFTFLSGSLSFLFLWPYSCFFTFLEIIFFYLCSKSYQQNLHIFGWYSKTFFSFKTWFINKFQGRDGSLESGDRFQSPCDNITATNLAF